MLVVAVAPTLGVVVESSFAFAVDVVPTLAVVVGYNVFAVRVDIVSTITINIRIFLSTLISYCRFSRNWFIPLWPRWWVPVLHLWWPLCPLGAWWWSPVLHLRWALRPLRPWWWYITLLHTNWWLSSPFGSSIGLLLWRIPLSS